MPGCGSAVLPDRRPDGRPESAVGNRRRLSRLTTLGAALRVASQNPKSKVRAKLECASKSCTCGNSMVAIFASNLQEKRAYAVRSGSSRRRWGANPNDGFSQSPGWRCFTIKAGMRFLIKKIARLGPIADWGVGFIADSWSRAGNHPDMLQGRSVRDQLQFMWLIQRLLAAVRVWQGKPAA